MTTPRHRRKSSFASTHFPFLGKPEGFTNFGHHTVAFRCIHIHPGNFGRTVSLCGGKHPEIKSPTPVRYICAIYSPSLRSTSFHLYLFLNVLAISALLGASSSNRFRHCNQDICQVVFVAIQTSQLRGTFNTSWAHTFHCRKQWWKVACSFSHSN